jgi:hypothetical protein
LTTNRPSKEHCYKSRKPHGNQTTRARPPGFSNQRNCFLPGNTPKGVPVQDARVHYAVPKQQPQHTHTPPPAPTGAGLTWA